MQNETAGQKVKEVLSQDIWGTIKEILNWGFHFGPENHRVHITLGTFLLIIVSFIAAGLLLSFNLERHRARIDQLERSSQSSPSLSPSG